MGIASMTYNLSSVSKFKMNSPLLGYYASPLHLQKDMQLFWYTAALLVKARKMGNNSTTRRLIG